MQESLSIIVPVRDRQSTVQSRTESLLELVSELSRRIQLILVDDFSSDATPEVLDDLRRKYPQVEVMRNRQVLGASQAADQALHRAKGDFIFLHPSYEPVDFDELVQLWRLRRDDQLVVARASTQVRRVDSGFVNRLKDWSGRLLKQSSIPPTTWNGLHMLKRAGLEQLASTSETSEAIDISHQSHRRFASPKMLKEQLLRTQP